MYIYELNEYSCNENELDECHISDYIAHEKEFTEDQFVQICEGALENIENNEIYELKKYLIKKHDFKALSIKARFYFDGIS
jgi:hypothetical protein